MVEDFKDEERGVTEDDGEREIEEPVNLIKMYKHYIMNIVALVAIGTNIFALLISQSYSIIASSVAALLNGPIVLYRECILMQIDSMRETQNELREQVNEVVEEKTRLEGLVSALAHEVKDLEESQQKLDAIAGKHGKSIDELRTLLADNEDTIARQKKIALAQISAQIVTTTMQSDFSGDSQLDGNEIDILVMRLKGIENIDINEKKLLKKINALSDKSVIGILQLLSKVDEYDFGETFNETYSTAVNKDRAIEEDDERIITFTKSPFISDTTPVSE